MVYLENIDDYNLKISQGGSVSQIRPKITLEARKDETGRAWIENVYSGEAIIISKPVGEVSYDGTVYGSADDLVDALNESLGSKLNYLSVLNDGNTFSRYDYSDTDSVVMLENKVSQWNDLSGNNRHLYQEISDYQPLWTNDGIRFDGIDDYMQLIPRLVTGLVKPIQIYILFKILTHAHSKSIFDGGELNKGKLGMLNAAYGLRFYAGAWLNSPDALDVTTQDNYNVVSVLSNGANSYLQVNEGTPVIGNPGTSDMRGLTVGSAYTLAGNAGFEPANVEIKEMIVRMNVDTDFQKKLIYDYLKKKI